MSLRLFQLDAAVGALLCHQEALQQHHRLVLRNAAPLLRRPQVHPQQQMPPEKPCVPFRQFARPFFPTLFAPLCLALSRLFSALPSASRSGFLVSSPTFCLMAPLTSWSLPVVLSSVLGFIMNFPSCVG